MVDRIRFLERIFFEGFIRKLSSGGYVIIDYKFRVNFQFSNSERQLSLFSFLFIFRLHSWEKAVGLHISNSHSFPYFI